MFHDVFVPVYIVYKLGQRICNACMLFMTATMSSLPCACAWLVVFELYVGLIQCISLSVNMNLGRQTRWEMYNQLKFQYVYEVTDRYFCVLWSPAHYVSKMYIWNLILNVCQS
jgi:hypothetical protein